MLADQALTEAVVHALIGHKTPILDLPRYSSLGYVCLRKLVWPLPGRGCVYAAGHAAVEGLVRADPVVTVSEPLAGLSDPSHVAVKHRVPELDQCCFVEALDLPLSLRMSGPSMDRHDSKSPEFGFESRWAATTSGPPAVPIVHQHLSRQPGFREHLPESGKYRVARFVRYGPEVGAQAAVVVQDA